MKCIKTALWALLLTGLTAMMPLAAEDAAMTLEQALDYLPGYELGQSRAPLTLISEALIAAHNNPDALKQIEDRFIGMLEGAATDDAKRYICRELEWAGSAHCVPAIAALLHNETLSNFAAWTLTAITAPEAAAALREALPKLPDALKPEAAGALGRKRDAEAVPALAGLLAGNLAEGNEAVAIAAARALGDIGDAEAGKFLMVTRDGTASKALREVMSDGALRAAEGLEGLDAVLIYTALLSTGEAGHIRAGALNGLVRVQPEQALDHILNALAAPDRTLAQAAATFVRDLPGSEATAAFSNMLPSAPKENQLLLIEALAGRGDPAAVSAVMEAYAQGDEDLRMAAMKTLGVLGDASAVPLLLEAAVDAPIAMKRYARDVLAILPGADVNESLLQLAESGDGAKRLEALRALGGRRAFEAKPLMMRMATVPDTDTRTIALRALRVIGAEEELPALLEQLSAAQNDDHRGEVERAIVAIAERINPPDRRADVVLTALPGATNPNARLALLRILGGIPNDASLTVLREALKEANPELRRTAMNGLASWPNDTPKDDLLAMLKSPPAPEDRAPAFEGYVRLLRGATTPSADELAARYAEAMQMAQDQGEKRLILSGIANLAAAGTLELTHAARSDAEVAEEATLALVRIARAAAGAYPEKVSALLTPLQNEITDDTLRAQIQETLNLCKGFGDYLAAWEYSGPYAIEGQSATMIFEESFPPEQGGGIWRIAPMGMNDPRPWVVNLAAIVGGEERVAYLRTRIHSPKTQAAVLELGTNDGTKVWLNGDIVHAINTGRVLEPGQDKVNVTLNEGWNTLLLAVYQQGGDWGACARLTAPDGAALPGLETAVGQQ